MDEQTKSDFGIQDILGEKREAILQLAARYGTSNIRVFGSLARGEARPDSDVDLLVSFPEDKSIFDLVGLWMEMKTLIGRDVSLIADTIDDKQFLKRALKDAVPL